MKRLGALCGFVLVCGLIGCSSDQQQETRNDLKKAGSEIRTEAKDLGRKVGNSIQPDGEPASEKMADAKVKLNHAALLAAVKTKLASDAGFSTLNNVDVSLNNGVVTLSGSASSNDQKRAAGIAASQVDGVTAVHNNLTVQP